MSLKTWKAEFYPVCASRCPKERAARHGLQKWLGLRKKSLKKHRLEQFGNEITDGKDYFFIDDLTSALCWHYAFYACDECPLVKLRGGLRCDEPDYDSPHAVWQRDQNIHPMLNLLRKAAKLEEEKYGP